MTLDGRDTSFLEWVGAAVPSLAKPGGAMHEVASTPPLIAEVRAGWSARGLCLRLAGSRLATVVADPSTSVCLVIGGSEVRQLQIGRSWIAVDSTVEIQIPFDRILVSGTDSDPRSNLVSGTNLGRRSEPVSDTDLDLQFAIQIREVGGAVLEAVPHGRFWTIAMPSRDASVRDWQV
ncbi:MAG TPA: hypothetical protein VNT81_14745 [Vicinamibacterales bacterium]|nr:hypothetical protein [Vicinamibacterales bacterium]